jgi:hypothetical protein
MAGVGKDKDHGKGKQDREKLKPYKGKQLSKEKPKKIVIYCLNRPLKDVL